MKLNKAETVVQAYNEVCWFTNCSNEICYREAVDTAYELGGIEVYNSSDGNSSWSFAPTRTFEFDDLSSVYIMYSGAFVIEPNEPY